LTEVSLDGTNVSDPKPLANHKKIKYLNFSYSQISDLKALTGMEDLEEIDLVGTAVSDLSPLANLPNLKKINCNQSLVKESEVGEFMKENPKVLIIHDAEKLFNWWNSLSLTWQNSIKSHLGITSNPTETDLAKLARLDSLSISKTDITNSLPLAMLPSLKFLNISNLDFDKYLVIKNLIKVEILNLGGTTIKDLSPLSDLKNLEELNIENTGVSSLASLSGLSRLKIVYADGSKITTNEVLSFQVDNPGVEIIYRTKQLQNWWETLPYEWSNYFIREFNLAQEPDTKSLHKLTSAKELIVDKRSGIHSLNVLHIYSGLKKLVLEGAEVDDLSYLGNLTSIEDLTITRINLQELSFLKSLFNLKRLDISETPVSTLNPLSDNSNLESLNCSGTLIRNIHPLKKLTHLKSLDFSNTKVGSLRSLMELNLDYLTCFNTRIAYYQVEKYKSVHPAAEVIYY